MSKFKYALAAVFAALLTIALPAWADYTWKTDVEGDFFDVNNWDRGPDDPELTTIDRDTPGTFVINSGNVTVDITIDPDDPNSYDSDCSLPNTTLNGGALNIKNDNDDNVSFCDIKHFTMTGGTLDAGRTVTLSLSGDGPPGSNYEQGTFDVSGGTINIHNRNESVDDYYNQYCGFKIEESGEFRMSGGTLNVASLYINNIFEITGGTIGTCDGYWLCSSYLDLMWSIPNGNTLTFTPESGSAIDLEEQTGDGNLLLDGAGTLILQSANYTGSTTINNGTLQLGADSTLYNLTGGTENNPVTLNAAGKDLTITTFGNESKLFVGSITASEITVNATDDAPFQVYTAANGAVRAESFVISSGRVDAKGCMEGAIDGEGIVVTVDGGVFSPGNSVGTVEVTGDVAITSNGIALFEFSSFSEGKYDQIIINGGGAFTAEDSTIQLDFDSDLSDWAAEGNSYKLVSNGGFTNGEDYTSWLFNYDDLFELKGGSDGLYLIGRGDVPEPVAGVPEPSTWALLALGAAGLMYWRKRKN